MSITKVLGIGPHVHWSVNPIFNEQLEYNPSPDIINGLEVIGASGYGGSYGMGGPGFFELDFSNEMSLCVCIWGATSWILLDGEVINKNAWTNDKEFKQLSIDEKKKLNSLRGRIISQYTCNKKSMSMTLSLIQTSLIDNDIKLSIEEDHKTRSVHKGNGKDRIMTGDLRSNGVIYYKSKYCVYV